ncbi:hypothetical protein LXA43DRAFT_939155 [Ganoderma leucocontextum]|nr:hypothetical protein LXA43DRAFT_939155 [Ganoderma leucocontextum]
MFSAVTSLTTYLGFPSTTRPRKRARASEDDRPVTTISLVKLIRDKEFWLNDGNIVLIARDVGFRIYRGLLTAQSTIFADMFSSPNSIADEYYDDCPVVRLSDSPEDLRYFLRVLVPSSHRMFYRDNDELPFTFDEISAVIRLSHKYHVADAQRQALHTLKLYFTEDFHDMERFEEDGLFLIKRSDAISAVNLARLTDTPSILPVTFYKCCELGSAVMDGCRRADGHVEHLSLEDHKICMTGRVALVRDARALVFRIFQETPSPSPAPLTDLKDLKHDEEFWLADGNLVLIAHDTAFRVYRGLVGLQSSVFADMFALSTSETDHELYEGSPVVRFSDSPDDLRHFLRELLPTARTLSVRYRSNAALATTFTQMSAVIRLSHKYQVEDILAQAVACLNDSFTRGDIKDIGADSADPTHAIGAVNLARLVDVPCILPPAFLVCCSIGGKVFDGWKRADGHVEYLDPDDLRRCMDGRDALAREALSLLMRVFPLGAAFKCGRTDCREAMTQMREDALNDLSASSSQCNLMSGWHPFITKHTGLHGQRLCWKCDSELEARSSGARDDIWNRLPQLFNLQIKGW